MLFLSGKVYACGHFVHITVRFFNPFDILDL